MRQRWMATLLLGSALMLGGCGAGPDEVNSGMIGTTTSPPTSTVASATPDVAQTGRTPAAPAPQTTRSSGPGPTTEPSTRCTDRIDYAGDPRSNAEINSIGENTGTCPPPQRPGEPVPQDPVMRCTDQINYAGDPRSNAEINSIGQQTGTCPPPIRK